MKIRTMQFLIIALLIVLGSSFAAAQKKASQTKKLRAVDVYFVKKSEEYDPKNPANLFAVRRRIDARMSLAGALNALMRGATKQEEKRGLFAPTYGIRLVSVMLNEGTAMARFTMPETAQFSGTNSAIYFIKAVEQTVLQFPEVKRVTVCLNGTVDFWREDEQPPQKC